MPKILNEKEKLMEKGIKRIVKEVAPKDVITLLEEEIEKRIQFKHTSSTSKPKFELIPYNALVSMANRFELGQKKYEEQAWNALSSQAALEDKEWIKSRLSHVIHHAYMFLMKMEGIIEDDGDDDAGGILWGGACLSEAYRIRPKGGWNMEGEKD